MTLGAEASGEVGDRVTNNQVLVGAAAAAHQRAELLHVPTCAYMCHVESIIIGHWNSPAFSSFLSHPMPRRSLEQDGGEGVLICCFDLV